MIYGFLAGIVAEALLSLAALFSITACRVECIRPLKHVLRLTDLGYPFQNSSLRFTLGTANCSWDVSACPARAWRGWREDEEKGGEVCAGGKNKIKKNNGGMGGRPRAEVSKQRGQAQAWAGE